MFDHSNIIRLRFSPTDFFLRTNVRWRPLFYSWLTHLRSQASASVREPCMHGATLEILRWCLSCPRRGAEKEAVTWTFNLTRSMKDNPSKVSNTFLEVEYESPFCARCVCCGLKQAATGGAWGSILLALVWLISCLPKSFMKRTTCSSCALCTLCRQASLYILPSHTHTAPSDIKGAGSTSSFPVSLTTNNMESRAAQAFATTTDWQSNGVSTRRSTRRLETGDFLGHAQEYVQRRIAPTNRPLRAGGRRDHRSGAWPS